MPNTTAEFWMSQAIHKGPFSIRNRHALGASPDERCPGDPHSRDTEKAKFMIEQAYGSGANMRRSYHEC
jgi:hypothetical protein